MSADSAAATAAVRFTRRQFSSLGTLALALLVVGGGDSAAAIVTTSAAAAAAASRLEAASGADAPVSGELLAQYIESQSAAAVEPLDFYCYSCASIAYARIWNQYLMGHYFPPRNFTELCWQPDARVGALSCRSTCFTLVEEIYDGESRREEPIISSRARSPHYNFRIFLVLFALENRVAVMRGCMDRFLLFGPDADIKASGGGCWPVAKCC